MRSDDGLSLPNGNLKVAVIGGGTGTFTVLSGLKKYTHNIAALVNMADDGGSTGKLRDELGVLPPGDVRQCLVALSRAPELRELFNYRFDNGELEGHAFGNLFLTALEKMTGDFNKAVALASGVLNIAGVVEPMTLSDVKLGLRDENGREVIGQFEITNYDFSSNRPEFFLTPVAKVNLRALNEINQADVVIIAPGNLYGSLTPALIVPGVGEALANSPAKKIYVCNLVTKPGQTDGFCVADFADEIQRIAGTEFLDVVLYNNTQPSQDLLEKYAKAGEASVRYDAEKLMGRNYRAIGADLISSQIWQNPNASDPIAAARTLIRHDPDAVVRAVIDLL